MKHLVGSLAIVVLFLCTGAHAQPVCLTMPPDSPVLSNSPDDIPATGFNILTYTGAHTPARANHNVAFVQTGANEQKVWFAPDAAPGLHKCFYNRRYRADGSSPWYWQYSVSPQVIEFVAPASAGPSVVLYSPTAKYVDTRTSTAYKYIMYQVNQPGSCDNSVAGFLYVAFSNDGICWTAGQQATRNGGPSFPCFSGHVSTVPVEQATAFDDGLQIQLIGMDGDEAVLANRYTMPNTQTYVWTATYASPSVMLSNGLLQVTNNNILNPVMYNSFAITDDRFMPYYYFFNMSGAFDAATGDLYLSRGYPYPFDRGSAGDGDYPFNNTVPADYQAETTFLYDSERGVSSPVGGCNPAPAILPNRVQVYKMHIGSLSNIGAIATGGWNLVFDLGSSTGYSNTWCQSNYAATPTWGSPMVNISRDPGALSFLRDPQGNLVRNGSPNYLMGDTYKLNKSNGAPCYITGLEREVAGTLP